MATSGILKVTVVEARLKKDANTWSTQDPYVMIENRMQRFKTKVAQDGGKEPKFGDEFEMDVKYIGDDLTMRIMTKNSIMSDSKVGEATIKISSMCVPGGIDDWWVVNADGGEGGKIHFNCTWEPKQTQAEQKLEDA